ncbi:Ig-like domain-containing protein [Listeria booriae]|uniref:Ig-like domain-containing protein n=1 Tax=Listeria booriae TaxID=1552123 RepID=UPI00287FFF6B|nr:Ig-like domain-containing protein [Listeria booriae]MDT0111467.1 Ig-like domain-containing protein [Listeria booriae]
MKKRKQIAALSLVAGLAVISESDFTEFLGNKKVAAAEITSSVPVTPNLIGGEEVFNMAEIQPKTAAHTQGLNYKSTRIWGIAEPGATISITHDRLQANSFGIMYSATADNEGNWGVDVTELDIADRLRISFQQNGSQYEQQSVTIITPLIDVDKVKPVTTNSTKIYGGGAVPGATVEVSYPTQSGGGSTKVIADATGNYEATIWQNAGGSNVTLRQEVVRAGQTYRSVWVSLLVIQGIDSPLVDAVSNKDTKITGYGKAGAQIRVKDRNRYELGTATADENGQYEVTIPKQALGARLLVTQEENIGVVDVSEPESVTVGQEAPEVTSELADGMTTVAGIAYPGADITVWTGGANIAATTKADALTGQWSATVPALVAGNAVQVRASLAFNQHKDSIRYAINLGNPTDIRAIAADEKTKVTGKGSPGATISVNLKTTVKRTQDLGTTTVDKDGNFELTIEQELDTQQLLITQSKNGLSSVSTEFTAVKGLDKLSDISTVTTNSTKVTGKGSAGATVSIKVNGTEIGTGQVGANGDFVATIAKQAEGTKLTLTQQNTENESAAVEATVVKGIEKVTEINKLSSHSVKVTGKGVAGSTISVKNNGTEIGTATTNDNGDFEITIPKQAEGSKLSITQSKAGDKSEAVEVTIIKGLAAPIISDYFVGDAYIRGTAPAEAVKVALIVDNKEIRSVNVTANGSYSIYGNDVAALQKDGATFSIVARDSNNLVSEIATSEVKSVLAPTLNRYQVGQTYVTGLVTEGVTRIAVYDKYGKLLKYGQINTDRTFKIYVGDQEAFHVAGESFTVRAFNASGAISSPVQGTIEALGLVAPIVNDYYLNSAYVTGTVSTGATKVRLSVAGVAIRVATVSSDGSYSIYVNDVVALKQVGATFEISALDGNNVASEAVTGVVKGLEAPVVNPYRVSQSYVTGTVSKDVKRISIFDKAGVILKNGQVNEDGTFKIYVNGIEALQVVGDSFTVKAFGENGAASVGTVGIIQAK